MGDARGRVYGDICIHIADSLCYAAETNITMYSNHTPIKMFFKKGIIQGKDSVVKHCQRI